MPVLKVTLLSSLTSFQRIALRVSLAHHRMSSLIKRPAANTLPLALNPSASTTCAPRSAYQEISKFGFLVAFTLIATMRPSRRRIIQGDGRGQRCVRSR